MMDQVTLGLSNLGGVAILGQDGPGNGECSNGDGTRGTDEFTPSRSTSPVLVHQSWRTSVYRFQDKGIKILLGGNLVGRQPQEWRVTRLSHEDTISRHLPLSCKRREVLSIQPFKSHPVALYFKWANGITLKEWMRKVHAGAFGPASTAVTHGNNNASSRVQHNDGRRSSLNESANGSGLMNGASSGRNATSHISTSTPPTPPATDDLNVRLRAAMAIAKTLSDFHDGGVAHNNLTPDNIVLDAFEGEYVATFIDLSEAAIFSIDDASDQGAQTLAEDMTAFEKQMKQKDLKSLGAVLNQLFRGSEDDITRKSFASHNTISTTFRGGTAAPPETRCNDVRPKRNKHPEPGEGLPIYLGSLISTLLLTGSEPNNPKSTASTVNYESAKDVYLDLKTMLENQNQCYRNAELDEWVLESKLKLDPDLFHGRNVEVGMLMRLLQSLFTSGDQKSIATISGHPGTGKSTLAYQMKRPIQNKDGFFIDGKFHKFDCADTVLSNALDNFFGSIIEKGSISSDMLMALRWRIHDAIGSGNNFLMDAIPNLRKLMAEETPTTDNTSPRRTMITGTPHALSSSHRLKFLFCKLIGAIACKANPLILFLDDLQWADEITLDVMRMILIDPDVNHFLFLGTYRNNEVSLSHPLTSRLNHLKENGVNIVDIMIGPMEKECVNTLVSELLCMPPNICRHLSNVIYTKTGGIIMFLLRFLKLLCDEGILWFSLSSRRWVFDIEKIRNKEISADVVQHLTLTMKRLDESTQMGLKTAACLGSNFDAEILKKAKKDGDFDNDRFLEQCVENGYLISIEGIKQFAWAHDQVHQAAYELIPIAKRESFHLLLGSRLLMKASSSETTNMLFFIVDNMNRGVKLLESSTQKHDLSFLNLRAGERAISLSAFHSASRYLMTGLSLLEHDSWEKHYNLTIRLYDAASEALYVTGDFSRLASFAEIALKFAKCFDHKLNIYYYLVRSSIASGRIEQGIATCFQVLIQLGESIPSTTTPEIIQSEIARIKIMLHEMSDDHFLSLPAMTDALKQVAMQFLTHLLHVSYIAKPALAPVVSFRMIEMSIKHGSCTVTPLAFGVYGAFLVSAAVADIEGGYRMGRVALELTKRMNAIEIIPRLYIPVYSMINIWKEPFQASLSKYLEAFDIGAHTGDTEFAISNLFQYVTMSIYGCGATFDGLIKDIHAFSKRAFQSQQHVAAKCLCLAHQLALDFMGVEDNAYSHHFPGMTEESFFVTSCQFNQSFVSRYICHKRKYVSFWTGKMDDAAEIYELTKQFPSCSTGRLVRYTLTFSKSMCSYDRLMMLFPQSFSDLVSTFIDGLIAFYFARKHRSDEPKWKAIGEDAVATLEKWEEGSTWNFRNKRLLLEGEFNFLKGNDEMAMQCYNLSIQAAHAHRFNHEEGLAYEKAATFLLHKNDHDGALDCFINAKKCYEIWGAHTIVARLEKVIAVLLPICARHDASSQLPLTFTNDDVFANEAGQIKQWFRDCREN